MRQILVLATLIALSAEVAAAKPKGNAGGVTPITSGVVIRGQTIKPPPAPGASGTKTGTACDNFNEEDVDQNGNMTGASVQAGNGLTLAEAIVGLPQRFNAYCVVTKASLLSGRLLPAPVPGNANHADLSAMKPKAAIQAFGGAIWR
ncbi:MAG: hypothetical protein ACYDD1_20510 [Caulobacteraceae bacterium]